MEQKQILGQEWLSFILLSNTEEGQKRFQRLLDLPRFLTSPTISYHLYAQPTHKIHRDF